MARFQLAAFAAAGADAGRLARDADLPLWTLASGDLMVSPRYAMRLWEVAEHALGVPDLALTTVVRYRVGELSLYDYLFTTAATLRDGLAVSSRYLPMLTTNGHLRVAAQSDRETTYSYAYQDADGRGADLALQLSVAVFILRAQAGTGRPVVPVHVAFAQDPPPSHRQFAEVLGTSRIDFGAPVPTFTS